MLELTQKPSFETDTTERHYDLAEMWRDEPWTWIESNEPYTAGDGNAEGLARRRQAKEEFIASDTLPQPDIDFPQLDRHDLVSAMVRFDEILSRMPERELDDNSFWLYESVAQKLAELMRHKFILDAYEAETEEDRQSAVAHAEELSVALFGEPKKEKVENIIVSVRENAASSNTPIARELVDMLPAAEHNPEAVDKIMTPETLSILRSDLEHFFAPALAVLAELPEGEGLPHTKSIEIIQEMIDAMGMEGCRALLVDKRVLEVSGSKMAVLLGKDRKLLTKNTFETVVLHELKHLIGHYVARQQDPDSALAFGLPGGLRFEEGLAVCIEQIMLGEAAERGENYYLNAGLRRGVVDGRKMSFREVYEIAWRKTLVTAVSPDEAAIMRAKEAAYDSVMRVSRGNATDTRDISYKEGNEAASEWLNYIATLPVEKRRLGLRLAISCRADLSNPAKRAFVFDKLGAEL